MAAWDQVSPGELAFDFTTPSEPKSASSVDWTSKDRASVKEAIIRWLEEQILKDGARSSPRLPFPASSVAPG
ncbi:MAG: hypothetical protein QM765_02190 [Myxococcales bacterium]